MKLQKVDPQKFGELLFNIDNIAFNRIFDLRARNIQEEVDYLKDCEVFISYQDKIPVGIVGYQIKDDIAEIKTLAVIPEYQGKGIGKEIITEILLKLKGKEVRLVTHPKNTSAIILYLKSGFKIYGWKENYYGDGEPRMLLTNNNIKFDKVVILHGCPPNEQTVTPKSNRWMNWLGEKLKEKGFDAKAPDMPTSWNPKYAEWKKAFEKYLVTKNTLLVGHSCGGAFIVRWLLETNKKVKKLILVAPAKVPETDDDTRKDLYNFELPINASKIADEIVVFTSNDFPHHLKSLEMYKKTLKPRIIKLENKFHFLYFQMKTNEFPELLEEIING